MLLELKQVGAVDTDSWNLLISEDIDHYLHVNVQPKDETRIRELGSSIGCQPSSEMRLRFVSDEIEKAFFDKLETDYLAHLEVLQESLD